MHRSRSTSHDLLDVTDEAALTSRIEADEFAVDCDELAASFDLDPLFAGLLGEPCRPDQLGYSILTDFPDPTPDR